jgi:hypothetical protein
MFMGVLAIFVAPAVVKQGIDTVSPGTRQRSPIIGTQSHNTTTGTEPSDTALAKQARSQLSAALGDHWHVALWYASCLDSPSIDTLPHALAVQLTPFGAADWKGVDTPITKQPTAQQRQIAALSLILHRQRIGSAANVEAASKLSEFMQWIIISLGLLTTIIVSLNATEYMKNSASKIVKALPLVAIMLPALGTAAGAVNAYYAPHEKTIQATRTLTSLSQLHSQMALEV